jgi:hypothetical protein
MTTLREISTAFGPEYLERYPTLPTSHRRVISAIQHCRSGHDGHSLSQCPRCGGHHRVHHACGNRPCPQGPQHKTQQWLQHHLNRSARHWYTDTDAQAQVPGCSGRPVYESYAL